MSVIIKAGSSIGNPDADEDDEFVFEGFVKLGQFDDILDVTKSKCIVIGRTGAGKTALVRYIQQNFENVIRFDPRKIAMDHIANSNIISFFESLGVDLHLFYELLWKHVICVALIKKMHHITNEQAEAGWFDKLRAQFRADGGKVECVEYLRSWGRSFWIDTDTQIKEIISNIESQLKAGAEAGYPGLKFSGEFAARMGEQQREEITQRAKKIVSDLQIGKLNEVLEIIKQNLEENRQKKYYICIDNLDERWVDQRVQFKLIRALIETIRSFRRVPQLKIVVALRADMYERALAETRDLGFQREKYEAYVVLLRWREAELLDLVGKRLNILYRNKYTTQNVKFSDIFAAETRRESTSRYLIERTLYRPRDIIAFVNHCLIAAEGQASISPKLIQSAEAQYSRRRAEALIEEWQSVHPELNVLLDFLRTQKQRIAIQDIAVREIIDDVVTKVLRQTYGFRDELIDFCQTYFETNNGTLINEIAFEMFSILYKVGAVSLKLARQQPYQSAFKDDPIIPRGQITIEAEARTHPMLWRALGITPNLG